MVMLNCKPNEQYGGVRVNGKFNFCADLIKVVVSPLQTSIGHQIDVLAKAVDLEGDPIEYLWTGTGGSFADPTAPETTYTCEQVGDQTITITVSDDGFEYCDCNWTVDITCVEDGGTGGTGGTGATGGQGGMGGSGGCIPDGGAQYAGPADRSCPGSDACGELEVCVDGTCEEAAMVFVSGELFTADLNGPSGADQICARLAEEAGLGGYWMSWTSDRCTSPQKRFHKSTIEYRLINGDQVAANWAELIDGEIDRDIRIDENGINLTTMCDITPPDNLNDFCFVWTNTDYEGYVHMNNGCVGLTWDADSLKPPAQSGQWFRNQPGWTQARTKDCAQDLQAIYCVEQSTAEPIP
jgi:hypothetical protein